MKKTTFLPLFLAVLLVFGGCSSATVSDTTASSPVLISSEAAAESTACVSFADPAVTESQTTTVPVSTSTTGTSASTKPQTTTSPATDPPSVPTETQTEAETVTRSLWSIFGGSSSSHKKSTTAEQDEAGSDVCFVTITCETIRSNLSSLKKGKEAFVPQSGVILDRAEVRFQSGESAFDAVKRACEENVCTDNCQYCQKSGIQLEYNFTPAFGTYYIEGIHQLYEKDCGSMSGWMFSVNGVFPTEGSSSYTVKPGDEIVFAYTCDMGDDIGNAY